MWVHAPAVQQPPINTYIYQHDECAEDDLDIPEITIRIHNRDHETSDDPRLLRFAPGARQQLELERR